MLNAFVADHDIAHVIEFGSGDGNQLSPAQYPRYVGYDGSPHAVAHCREQFAGNASMQFHEVAEYDGRTAPLVLSLDVVFHLIEDAVYEAYMQRLYGASERWVIVYATDSELADTAPHVRHRRFTAWVRVARLDFPLRKVVPNDFPPERRAATPHPQSSTCSSGSRRRPATEPRRLRAALTSR